MWPTCFWRVPSCADQTALRLAVGATRGQIVLQALTESAILALAGGIAGLFVSVAAARLLLSLAFSAAHFLPISVTPSLPVLAFAFALSLLTALIFGAAPAWLATRVGPAEACAPWAAGQANRSSLATRSSDFAGDPVSRPDRGAAMLVTA